LLWAIVEVSLLIVSPTSYIGVVSRFRFHLDPTTFGVAGAGTAFVEIIGELS
jgi:hypothetical protein